MSQKIVQVSILVRDYDEAIDFYTRKLQFELVEDTVISETKRWVVVSPSRNSGCSLLLAKAVGEEQEKHVGNQTGGRVFLFLHTNHIARDLENLKHHGIQIIRDPVKEEYGTVLVFADLYGNLWDLIEPAQKPDKDAKLMQD